MKLVKSIPAQHWLPQENLSDRSHFLSLTDHSPQKWGGGSLCLQLSTPLSSKSPYLFPTLSPSPPSSHPQENWKLFNLHLTWNIFKNFNPLSPSHGLHYGHSSDQQNISKPAAFVVLWGLKNIYRSCFCCVIVAQKYFQICCFLLRYGGSKIFPNLLLLFCYGGSFFLKSIASLETFYVKIGCGFVSHTYISY